MNTINHNTFNGNGNELLGILGIAKSTGKLDVDKLEKQVKKFDEAILIINKFYTVPDKIKLKEGALK